MRLSSRLMVGWLCFATLMVAHAAEEDLFSSLTAALRDDIASLQRRSTGDSATTNRLTQERSALFILERACAANLTPAQQSLQQLLASNLPPPLANEVNMALQSIQNLRVQQAQKLDKKTADALTRAKDVVLKASRASELDAFLIELRQLMDVSEPFQLPGCYPQSALKRLRDAAGFLQKWQNYLWAIENGKFDTGIKVLTDLDKTEQNALDIPRSEILARVRSSEEKDKAQADGYVTSTLQSIGSLDDLASALMRLRSHSAYQSLAVSNAVNGLDAICKSYLAFKAGVATTLPPTYWQTGGTNLIVTRLRAELLLLVLPRILGTEQTDPPNSNETVETYLIRMRATAIAQRNFELLSRTLSAAKEISSSISGPGQSLIAQDDISFLAWREGQNAERANRFSEATLAYRRALNSATPAIPVEFIAERLDAIEKEHPDEFRRAGETGRGYYYGQIIPRAYETPSGLTVPAVSPRPTPLRTPTPTASPMP
jgi:hypothetical protein